MRQEALKIGVLALQGGFSSHINMLQKLSCHCFEVKYSHQLQNCDGLILPGGESTTLSHLIENQGFKKDFINFAEQRPIFGTCAGLIMMSKYGLIDVAIIRNAYGRQTDSFSTSLQLSSGLSCEGVFIRAPKIKAILSNHVKILATYQGEAVMVRQGHLLGSTFHPELTENTNIHKFFIELCKEKLLSPQL